ncbi:unnamed protein product [Victoria cruziana]
MIAEKRSPRDLNRGRLIKRKEFILCAGLFYCFHFSSYSEIWISTRLVIPNHCFHRFLFDPLLYVRANRVGNFSKIFIYKRMKFRNHQSSGP